MRFIVDQPISWEVARDLQNAGHDAIHVRDIGMAPAADEDILAVTMRQNRVVVTQDTDYGTIVITRELSQPSIVLFRMRDGRPSAQSAILLQHMSNIAEALENGAIVVVNDAAIRIRRLAK